MKYFFKKYTQNFNENREKMIRFCLAAITCILVGNFSGKAQNRSTDFDTIASNTIDSLMKQFPTNSGWEIISGKGDSVNSFTLVSKALIWAYYLTEDMIRDSSNEKFKIKYYLTPPLSPADSLRMRKQQDAVTKASFALMKKYGIGVADADGHVKESSPADKKKFEEENHHLEIISPTMPVITTNLFSVYILEPSRYSFCNDDGIVEKECELMQYGILNYFRKDNFNYDELLNYRKAEEEELKRKQEDLDSQK